VRKDKTGRPLEQPGEGRQYKTAIGETRGGETVQNGHRRNQVREHSTEQPMEIPDEGKQYRTATGEPR